MFIFQIQVSPPALKLTPEAVRQLLDPENRYDPEIMLRIAEVVVEAGGISKKKLAVLRTALDDIAKAAGKYARKAFEALANKDIGRLFVKKPEKVAEAFAKIVEAIGEDAKWAFHVLKSKAVGELFAKNPQAFVEIAEAVGKDAWKVFDELENETVGRLFERNPEGFVEIVKAVVEHRAEVTFRMLENPDIARVFVEKPEETVKAIVDIANAAGRDTDLAFKALGCKVISKLFAEDPKKVAEAFKRIVEVAWVDTPWAFQALMARKEDKLDFFTRLDDGLCNRLKEEFNIDFIMRYPGGVLEDMLSGRRDPARPLAIIAYPKYDHNRAFYLNKIWQLYRAGFQVVVFESGNEGEFMEWAERIVAKWGPADVVVLGGHGEPQKIRLGAGESEENFLDVTDNNVLEALKPLVGPGGVFVLDSCSTGDPKTTDNIARLISERTGTIVFAPDRPTAISNFNIQYDENGRPVLVSVEYSGPTEQVYEKGERQ
ncbi:MAG: hypothetical protein QXG98_03050 [Candidatus Micrarchaeia archaeon]